jgi:photosystem II stability/assembly factor-like uncharacterized protein
VRRLLAVAAGAVLLAGCTSSTKGSGSAGSTAPPSSAPASTASSTPSSSAPPAPSTSSATVPPAPRSGPLNGLQIADLTFVGTEGWALGTVGCTSGSGRCTAIAHSTDNGRSWHSIVPPKVNVSVAGLDEGPCADPCVQHIRFATSRVGYLFAGGGRTLLMTTDRGRTWHRQPGGADALESLAGDVIRVDDRGGCPPGCRYRPEVAGIGSAAWQPVSLPGPAGGTTTGVTVGRTGSRSYLIVYGHTAGGGSDARSILWTSADGGRRWTRRGEPCPQGGREVDSTALTTAPDGSVTVLCVVRGPGYRPFTATSTDGGAHFVAGSRTALGAAPVGALAAAARNRVFVSSDDTYLSTDGGRHFRRLSANGGSSPGALGWLGFASSTVGHAVSVDRRTIWTTTDGGRDWTAGKIS